MRLRPGLQIVLLVGCSVLLPGKRGPNLLGVVTDANGAVYAKPNTVEVSCAAPSQCGQLHETGVLSGSGEFSFQLPPGKYRVKTSIPHCFPYERAPVTVTQTNRVWLHLIPRLHFLAVGVNGDGSEFKQTAATPHVDRLPISGSGFGLIEYERKQQVSRHEVKYEAAVFTYEQWTVGADTILWSDSRQKLVAEGRVRVENGREVKANGAQKASVRVSELFSK